MRERLYTVVFYGVPTMKEVNDELDAAFKIFPNSHVHFSSGNGELSEVYMRIKEVIE